MLRSPLVFLAVVSLVALQPSASGSYVVTTMAGASGFGYKDGANAQFALPQGVAMGPDNTVYVADTFNLAVRHIAADGTVTTVAGRPWNQYGDGPADSAGFAGLSGIAIDTFGNIFVSETSQNTIRKIGRDGTVTTYAGFSGSAGSADGVGTAARFRAPQQLAVDAAGNVYVADSGNATVRKIGLDRTVTTIAGRPGVIGAADGPVATATFQYPYGVAVGIDNSVYVSDWGAGTVRKISGGVVSTMAGLAGTHDIIDGNGTGARFDTPAGLTVDGQGNVYVTDYNADVVRRITPTGDVGSAGNAYTPGDVDLKFTDSTFNHPIGITIDTSGNLYVADMYNEVVRKLDVTSVLVKTVAGTPTGGRRDGVRGAARFFLPQGMAYDTAGDLYIAENYGNAIRKMTPDGTVTTLAGGSSGFRDGTGLNAEFNLPSAMAVDGAGNVYVADYGNDTIRKISPAGAVVTLAGSAGTPGSADGQGNAARFFYPSDVKLDPQGNLIVADSGNDTLRRVTPDGIVTTIAGSVKVPGAANGSGLAARFHTPWSLTFDASGNLYVGEIGNFDVRKMTPSGAVSTFAGSGQPGSNDGSGAVAQFGGPWGLAADANGNIFVADGPNNAIREIGANGLVSTIIGTGDYGDADGVSDVASFMQPSGIAVDANGNLAIADAQNNTIRHAGVLQPANPQSSIVNLSVRVNLLANVRLITGFYVSGAPKPILIRGVGPGLAPYVGTTTTAGDPRLELYDGSSNLEQSNDNWGGSQALRDAFNSVGAFALPADSLDAVILATMGGLHSAHLLSSSPGLALVEAYNTSDSVSGRLTNVSARYTVGSGAAALTAGFVISGTVPKTVLIRGIGPTLANYGISTAITNPVLTVFNSSQQSIATNDDWDVGLTTTFSAVGAFALASHSKDAAMLITLPPGLYSAQVGNGDAQTGDGMIEVYDVGN